MKQEEKDLRTFCKQVFYKEKERIFHHHDEVIKLKIRKSFLAGNGRAHIVSFFGKDYYAVIINLLPILRLQNSTLQMKKFYIYNTIVHELTHIKMQVKLRKSSIIPYAEFLAAWNQWFQFESLSIPLSPNLIPDISKKELNERKRRRWSSPAAEVFCVTEGMERAYKAIGESLSETERSLAEKYLTSLRFIKDKLEITYGRDGYPRDLFVFSIKQMQKYIRAKKGDMDRIPVLRELFHEDGTMLTVEELVKGIDDGDAPELFQSILLHVFIHIDCAWNKKIEYSERLRELLSVLSNEYCDKCVKYLEGMKLGEVFVPKYMLQDNAAMLIKNATRLNKKMELYGLERTSGSVIALY